MAVVQYVMRLCIRRHQRVDARSSAITEVETYPPAHSSTGALQALNSDRHPTDTDINLGVTCLSVWSLQAVTGQGGLVLGVGTTRTRNKMYIIIA